MEAPIYDRIGIGYNRTRKADPYLLGRMQDLLRLQPSGKYLDIGCGTGNYTIALFAQAYAFIGLDPSTEMLDKARLQAPEIVWISGRAESIPLDNAGLDGILASLTVHHWGDLEAGLGECARVLKAGGRMVIFTATPQQMEGYWLCHYFPQMLRDSMQVMPDLERLENAFSKAGLRLVATEKYFIQPDLQDLFLYGGKHQPARYFDPQIRSGISSFAAFSHADEVAAGLVKMETDIAQGKIQGVIDHYANEDGDYLFLVLEKE